MLLFKFRLCFEKHFLTFMMQRNEEKKIYEKDFPYAMGDFP